MLTCNDFDLPAIDSQTSQRWSEATESLTNGRETQETVLDSYLEFAPDVGAACGSHCHYDSVASNTDKTISKTLQHSSADLGSTVDSWIDEEVTAGVEEIEYYCTATLTQLMLVLEIREMSANCNELDRRFPSHLMDCRNLPALNRSAGLSSDYSQSSFAFDYKLHY